MFLDEMGTMVVLATIVPPFWSNAIMLLATSSIEYLTERFLQYKKLEAEAKASKNAIEAEIAKRIPRKGKAKQVTKELENGVKVTVTRGLNITSTKIGLDSIRASLTGLKWPSVGEDGECWNVPPPIKKVNELDLAGYEWYRANAPAEVFALIAEHVTVKDKKESVTVKLPKPKGE